MFDLFAFWERSHCGKVLSTSACQAGHLWFKFRTSPSVFFLLKLTPGVVFPMGWFLQLLHQHPTSAETHMWGKWLAAMLAIYTGRGVSPEVNLRDRISHMPLQSLNKAAHSGFETQRRHHQKSKTGVSVAPIYSNLTTKSMLQYIDTKQVNY